MRGLPTIAPPTEVKQASSLSLTQVLGQIGTALGPWTDPNGRRALAAPSRTQHADEPLRAMGDASEVAAEESSSRRAGDPLPTLACGEARSRAQILSSNPPHFGG